MKYAIQNWNMKNNKAIKLKFLFKIKSYDLKIFVWIMNLEAIFIANKKFFRIMTKILNIADTLNNINI